MASLNQSPRPVIIGIAGGTASGKTTLAHTVTSHLNQHTATATLLTHDRYYRTLGRDVEPTSYNFDHPDALETDLMVQHVQQLKAGEPAHIPNYDFAKHARLPSTQALTPTPWLFVEGILVLSEPRLRQLMDYRIFVHTPSDIRLIRRIRRDMNERGRQLDGILAQYERTVHPMHETFVEPTRAYADLEFDGTSAPQQLVQQMLTWMQTLA